mmetsp:Transcript_45026/g.88365  ORF Transcript_45026/g.88365 Transcript_45026/m.88365 type:complete len:112 (-) Transcript_45026:117-452(-)
MTDVESISTNPDEHHIDPPLKHLKLTATRPCLSFGLACGAHCFFFLLFIILVIVGGSTFLPFQTGVGNGTLEWLCCGKTKRDNPFRVVTMKKNGNLQGVHFLYDQLLAIGR